MSDHPGPQVMWPVLLGVGEGDWLPVTAGESGAAVSRSADATRYAKCVSAADAADLEAERDRVAWLNGRGVPGPRVLDWRSGDAGACLMTSAVSGVPADQVPAEGLWTAWEPIADAVRRLHEVPVSQCPFRRGLDAMLAVARDVVARDAVNPEFLPAGQQHTPTSELLDRIVRQVPRRREQEAADTVVCHGEARVVREDGTDAGPGEVGELCTRGPYTLRGYYRASERNRTRFTADGHYRSGDLVRRTAVGDLEVVGRNDDVVNRGGTAPAASADGRADLRLRGDPRPGTRTDAASVPGGHARVRDGRVQAAGPPRRPAEAAPTGAGRIDKKELRGILEA